MSSGKVSDKLTLPRVDSKQEINSINEAIEKPLDKNKESLVSFNSKKMNNASLKVDKLERLWKPINKEYETDMADLKRLKAEYQDWVDTGGAGWFVWDEPEADTIQRKIKLIENKWRRAATSDVNKELRELIDPGRTHGDLALEKHLERALKKIDELKGNYNKARTRLDNLKKIK